MKPLDDHVLLYDDDCPMCTTYSRAFVKTKMLEKNGVMPYTTMSDDVRNSIDVNRARNEIALLDVRNQKVTYGIESWFKVFANSFPVFKPLFHFLPFYWMMKGVYSFVSYNRKVIAPGKIFYKSGACYPDYNIPWRWIYILLTSFFVAFSLNKYFNGIPIYRDAHFSFVFEWLIAIGQLAFQGAIVFFLRKDRMLHYFGQLMTIATMGALLLIPMLIVKSIWRNIPMELYTGYFAIPVIIMLWQHVRRVKILELPSFLTATWILYRIILLTSFFIRIKLLTL